MEGNNTIAEPRSITNRLLGAKGVDNSPAPLAIDADSTGWGFYNARTQKSDGDDIRDWSDSLNTLLIFAALYSAILTAFIIESMKLIQEDYTETTRNVLIHMSQQLANRTMEPFEEEPFSIPDYALRVNYYFFASISFSLAAALSAVFALQWVGSYSAGLELEAKKRALRRHLRRQGVQTWRMSRIIAFLPFLLFLALFLFLIGLVEWMWTIHHGIAAVVIAGLVFAAVFIVVTTLISMIYVKAPFRTPVTRSLPRLFFKLYRSLSQLLSELFFDLRHPFPKVLSYPCFNIHIYTIQHIKTTMIQLLRDIIELPKALYTHLKSLHRKNLRRDKCFNKRELDHIESNNCILAESVLAWSFDIIKLSSIVLDQHVPVIREIFLLPQDQFRAPGNLHGPVLKWLLAVVNPDRVVISSVHLDILRCGFERMYLQLESAQINSQSSLLSTPLAYVEALKKLEEECENKVPLLLSSVSEITLLHSSFTLSLARNLSSISSLSEKSSRIQELILMMWIFQALPNDLDPNLVETDVALGWQGFFNTNKSVIGCWIKGAQNVPHIQEILGHIALAMAEIPGASPLWRAGNSKAADPHLFEALQSFDRLISQAGKSSPNQRCPPGQHYTLVDLICRDLEMGPPETFKVNGCLLRYVIEDILKDMSIDPCLKMLAGIAAAWDIDGIHFPLDKVKECYGNSWVRIAEYIMKHPRGSASPRIQRLQASAWPAISAENQKLCKDAINDPTVLAHVQLIFKHDIPCSDFSHGEAHMLLHLFHRVPSYGCLLDAERPLDDVLRGKKIDSLLNLLILPNTHELFEIPFKEGTYGCIPINPKCIPQILAMVREVTNSRPLFIRIMADVNCRLVDSLKSIGAEDIVALSIGIERALAAPDNTRVESNEDNVYGKLLVLFQECVCRMEKHKARPSGDEEQASKLAVGIISRLKEIVKV